ncbi:hypothetical protein BU15DRAFT_58762 [Melanogaster broomeanus]|nr:hypothetical protein BU15DRAFT_58762 [Melanogaster broomeanus]
MSNDTHVFKVAGVVAFYMVTALVMVFVNKAVLINTPHLPLLFLFLQLSIAVILLHVSAAISSRVVIPKLELDTAKKLTPVVVVNIIGLIFNTLCLREVEASFFQIARGLVLPLTVLVSSVSTRSTPSLRVVGAVIVVTAGFLLGVVPSPAVPAHAIPSALSLLYGFLSSLFIAFHAVLIKSSLPHCDNSTIQLAYWTNLGSAAFLVPFIILRGELVTILEDLINDSDWEGNVFLWGSLVTGIFGFLLCIAGLLSIKVTSPVTHMFSSAARSVIQTVLGVVLFKDIMTANRAGSIFVILLGTIFYTWVKSVESAPPPPSRRDIDLEALVSRDSEETEDDGVTVVFDAAEKEEK